MDWKLYIPVFANIVVSIVSGYIGYRISKHTIDSNRNINIENTKINAENVGKNRTIYEIERYASPQNNAVINEKLSTGNWTVLGSFSDPGNWSTVIIVLGRIKST